MKVLVNRRIVHGPWGGGNNFVVALVEGLTKAGHEVVHSLEAVSYTHLTLPTMLPV